MPRGHEASEMVRVSVQLTEETRDQVYAWANEAGVKPGYFLSMALTTGARILARQLHPEKFLTTDQWQVLGAAMGFDEQQINQIKAKLAEQSNSK